MKQFKVEFLLDGDVTPDGVVTETHGRGEVVVVDFEDGSSKTYTRGELVSVQ